MKKIYYNSDNIKLCGILNKSNTDKIVIMCHGIRGNKEEFGKEYEDLDVIQEFMSKLKSNSKILDLGGGTGKLTDLFIKNNYDAICYDF